MKEYTLKVNGNDYSVKIKNVDNNIATVSVNGAEYKVQVDGLAAKHQSTSSAPAAVAGAAKPLAAISSPPATASGTGEIKSPLPGVILDVAVKVGDAVKTGQRLMVLEAMKMENNIDSDRDGTVKSIKANKGDSVLEGDLLITIG